MRSFYYFIATFTLLMFVGCKTTDKHDAMLISRAEKLCVDKPDSALSIIRKVDRQHIHGDEDIAHYRLVYSEVLYHNRIDSDCDTLTRPMADYYMSSTNHEQRARALYQHALVLQRMGHDHAAEAMVMLLEAEASLAKVDNPRLCGLVHRTKGDIYGDGCLFANALESYRKATTYFDAIGLHYHSASATYDMGATYIQLREFESAEEHLLKALEYGISANNKGFQCAVLHELLDLSIYMDDYTKCRTYLDAFAEHDCALYGEAHLLAMEAMYLSHNGKKSEALAMLDTATEAEDAEWADLEYARYIVYRNSGDANMALHWQEMSKHAQDQLMIEVLEQPVLNVQIDMLRGELDAKQREQQLVHQRNVVIYTAIAVIALLVFYLVWRRMRSKNRDIAHYVETIRGLKESLDSVPKEMSASISELYRDRFSELNELCDIYYDHSGSSRHKSMVFNKLNNTIDAIKSDSERIAELERAVNEYRGGLMSDLRSVLPKLSERDYRVALYSFAGFSNRAIALFIDSDPVSVSKIKYNIKYKMRGETSETAQRLVTALSEK